MNTNIFDRLILTEENYEDMDWYESTVHAMAFFPDSYELAIDIDFIFEWFDPGPGEKLFKMKIAPCTMVFENVNELLIDLDVFDEIRIEQLSRDSPRVPSNAAYISKQTEWNWILDSTVGRITLYSVGYNQYVRHAPIITENRVFTLSERGGISFIRGVTDQNGVPHITAWLTHSHQILKAFRLTFHNKADIFHLFPQHKQGILGDFSL